ncbi:MAG: class I SAM-dependent methyltransferase [Bacteroidetes bacterium]|nr:class I SAM-dependent methyltransferase [Bacteroidota bacterium]
MSEFDELARDWDLNPVHTERSKAIAEQLLEAIPVHAGMSALEYGAGTGLLSIFLQDKFREITLMDSSREMIRVISEKISLGGIKNLKPVLHDLETEPFPGKFDFIYSQMVFHHVGNIDGILKKFNDLLNPGGYLAIADLYPEDGSFHGEGFTGHKGFDVEKLTSTLKNHGFTNIHTNECFVIRRTLDNGNEKEYPVFLMTANK